MIQKNINGILRKVLKVKSFCLPCGAYSAARILADNRRAKIPADKIEGDRFTIYRGKSVLPPRLGYLFCLEGEIWDTEEGCQVDYRLFPCLGLLIPTLLLTFGVLSGLIALIAGRPAMLFLVSVLGLDIIQTWYVFWLAKENHRHFQKTMLNKSRKYAQVVPE